MVRWRIVMAVCGRYILGFAWTHFATPSGPVPGPTLLPYPLTGGCFIGNKTDEARSWPLMLCSDEDKNARSFQPPPSYVFMVWCLNKHTNNNVAVPTVVQPSTCCSPLDLPIHHCTSPYMSILWLCHDSFARWIKSASSHSIRVRAF
jgi:hypothetical protein